MRTRNPPPESRKLPIAIACRLDKEVALKITRKVLDYLFKEKQVKVALENRIAQRFYPHLRMDLRQMTADKIKMVLSIGGDGTILRVAQNLPYKNPAPILGVNLGSVGFLDECDSNEDDLYKTLDKIVEGKYFIENVMRISGIYNGQRLPDALNEIYICSAKPSKVLHVGIKVNKQLITTGYLDGIIISTPVGTTAYCLSAGGCLIDPTVMAMEIVPVNPFAQAGNLKPIIVPATAEITIQLLRPGLNALIIVDGQREYKAYPNTSIKITKSVFDFKFVKLKENFQEVFYSKLRKKILTGVILPKGDSPEQ